MTAPLCTSADMKTHIAFVLLAACGPTSTTVALPRSQGAAATGALSAVESFALPEGTWRNVFATPDAKVWVLESAADDLYVYTPFNAFQQLELLPISIADDVPIHEDAPHGWKIEVVHEM